METPSKTVAVIDDDESVRDATGALLDTWGWRASTYASGEAFLADVQAGRRWDCVLLDLRLPGIDGVAVQERLAGLGLAIPIVILTASPDSWLARRSTDLGAPKILCKPTREAELMSALVEAMERSTVPRLGG